MNPLEPLLLDIIERITKQRLTPEQYDLDLLSLGVDSLAAIDISNEIETAMGVVIDDREIYRFRSVRAILEYFARQQR